MGDKLLDKSMHAHAYATDRTLGAKKEVINFLLQIKNWFLFI